MNAFRDFFRDWFGYSRRERRSTFILLNIIVVITGIRYFFPLHYLSFIELPVSQEWITTDTSRDGGSRDRTSYAPSVQDPVRRSAARIRILDLNACDSASLEALPGIGPVLSARIIKYRRLLGGYASVDQLREVYGLPEETFGLISGRLSADSLDVKRIRVNSATFGDLIRHPYFRKEEVPALLKYRELNGRIDGLEELLTNRVISVETAGKIVPYLAFD